MNLKRKFKIGQLKIKRKILNSLGILSNDKLNNVQRIAKSFTIKTVQLPDSQIFTFDHIDYFIKHNDINIIINEFYIKILNGDRAHQIQINRLIFNEILKICNTKLLADIQKIEEEFKEKIIKSLKTFE